MEDCELLLTIAGMGMREVNTSTCILAKKTGISQQTVSRKLRKLEDEGLIERQVSPRGIRLKVSEGGREYLMEKYRILQQVLEKPVTKITGVLHSSMGEGKYYTMQGGYQKQFEEKLGFAPYPGTLNIRSLDFDVIVSGEPVVVDGFKTEERSFGMLNCYPVRINGEVDGAVIVPERTHHKKDVLEVVAPVGLRKKFGLKDGDDVELEVIL